MAKENEPEMYEGKPVMDLTILSMGILIKLR